MELNIYNKMGGAEKYRLQDTPLQLGGDNILATFIGSSEPENDNDDIDRIRRLEEKIDKLQTELKKLKAKIK
jgi:hypothetical protein|tara:strand:- start:347 stop:562 length:216 start_codon:yes stop_codon:yes gene_type:complete